MDKQAELRIHIVANNYDEVKKLLIQGANPNTFYIEGKTALHVACLSQMKIDIIKLLIEHGADVDLAGTYYTYALGTCAWTSLQWAIFMDYDTCVDLLLKSGADLSKVDFDGMTAIEYAESHGYHQIIKLIEQNDMPVKGVHN